MIPTAPESDAERRLSESLRAALPPRPPGSDPARVSDDAGLFSGVLRDSGGFGAGNSSCTGPMFVRTATTTNCTGETVGWVGRKGADPATDFALGVGCFQTGWTSPDAAPPAHDPWFPKKGFSMHGGLLRLQGEWTAWSGGDPRGAVRDPDDSARFRAAWGDAPRDPCLR